ncbi:AAA family ATPase [Schaalia hyovaginalis]|uniref:AAA family ATPase n=1 Tax=Schaalia hyovaginalis TaxID=29316 RepID=UPI0026EFDD8D|nr:AAA family ATPase [Schaalia hyovaginalis]MDD7554366.1 AAA family ATPase [Schaalia hyovaginalis]MDY3093552.1 AAA family ATPase [Schaalia hyovaginalis]MDY5473035.1 AAA family ATPase [Collinsella sp.]
MGFSWEIKVKGFGPFSSRAGGTLHLNNARVAIYSGNGQGKTCISRLFRAAEPDAGSLPAGIINRDGNSGIFSFKVSEKNGQASELRVEMRRGEVASVENRTGYLFHVFNSDYVAQNLARVHYSPSGDISGYIIGKENIDVSDKKEKLEAIRKQGAEKRRAIEDAVTDARSALSDYDVTRIKEFSELTAENVMQLDLSNSLYDNKVAEYEALKELPETAPQLGGLTFEIGRVNLDRLESMLPNTYTRDDFSEDFLSEVLPKRGFIESGLSLTENEKCPFCGRDFDDGARALIHTYEEYIAGQESKTIGELEQQSRQIENLRPAYRSFFNSYQANRAVFDQHKGAFPSMPDSTLPIIPTLEEFDSRIDSAKESLLRKIADISLPIPTDSISVLRETLESISRAASEANQILVEFEKLCQKSSRALTEAKRGLCIEMAKKVRAESGSLISERAELLRQYETLEREVREEESRSKRSKRDAVAELFARMMHGVYGDKYVFDKKNFAITFKEVELNEDAEQVLSDGEKSVLAFCHYIASTLMLLEEDSDAEKLFFVIDDPISSLDYHYVYSVAQTIRDLGNIFGTSRYRFIVLTHSSAFFNMLARNNIASGHYIMNNGLIDRCAGDSITPYSEHLKDVYAVCSGDKPTHTTGNSIRQIIETLWRFDNPAAQNLLQYLGSDDCNDLAQCEYIYMLCQDQSHGASIFDRQDPLDEDSVRRACWAVLEHIHRKYPGQLVATDIDFSSVSKQ